MFLHVALARKSENKNSCLRQGICACAYFGYLTAIDFNISFEWIEDLWRKEISSRGKIQTGQSYKTFYTLGQIYKHVLKLDNMLLLRKYLVRILGH